jgi:glycosyltransferase involved in cell wall biosynthesis
MHILVIPSWYPNINNEMSGIFFKEQTEALAKNDNLKVGCIALNESSPFVFRNKYKTYEYIDAKINHVNTVSLLYPMSNRLKTLRSIVRVVLFKILFKRYIKKYGKPDIVHLHSFGHGELALWVKEVYKIPFVLTEHSSGFARKKYNKKELLYAKNIFNNSSYNIAVSQEFANLLTKIFNLKFNFIPNSIDVDFFQLKEQKKSKKIFQFINIAFLDKKKNQDLLIEAFARVFKNNKDVTLLIVGDGVEYDNLKSKIIALGMQNQIQLYGRANRSQIRDLFYESDAFVLSSEYETFGVVIIEAMACGLPVISTKCGGPESIITNENLGILCELSQKSLSQSMYDMYSNIETYNSPEIRRYVEDCFSSSAVSRQLIKIYKNIVEISC